MRQFIGVLAASAAVVIGLSGCASSPEPQVKSASNEAANKEQAAPLSASPEEVTPEPESPEEAFLIAVRPFVEESTQIADASDEQLIAAGVDACAQMAGGTPPDDVRVIEGERKNDVGYYVDSSRIGGVASRTLCP